MDDLRFFDPGVTSDVIPGKYKNTESINLVLTFCLIASIILAGYFAYRYYKNIEEDD